MYKLLIFSLIFASSSSAQYLDHDYNLGRIVGGNYHFSTTAAEIERDAFQVAPAMRYRLGVAERYQWDVDWTAYASQVDERFVFGVGAVRLGGNAKISDGHVIDWDFQNQNVAITGTGHSIITGFDQKYQRLFRVNLQDRYLSHNGYIQLDSSDYQLAFLRRPLLDMGQYGHTLQVHYDYNGESFHNWEASYLPILGLLPSLQMQLDFGLHLTKLQGITEWSNRLGLASEYRLKQFWARIASHQDHLAIWDDATDLADYTYTGAAGFMFGRRNLQFAHVNGNYDGYFTRQLGKGQIYLQHQTQSRPYESNKRVLEYISSVQLGVHDLATLGATHNLTTQGENHSLTFSALFSSIPLRTEGPYDVSDMEYLWGPIPAPGHWRLSAQWRTPLLKPSQSPVVLGSSLYHFQGSPPNAPAYTMNPYWSTEPDFRANLLLAVFERAFTRLEYSYTANGLIVNGDTDNPRWSGKAHNPGIAMGYAHFNAIYEAGILMQIGANEDNGKSLNVFPIYARTIMRF